MGVSFINYTSDLKQKTNSDRCLNISHMKNEQQQKKNLCPLYTFNVNCSAMKVYSLGMIFLSCINLCC